MYSGNFLVHLQVLMDVTYRLNAHLAVLNSKRVSQLKKFLFGRPNEFNRCKAEVIWSSVGFPGNSHDSTILQSTNLYDKIVANGIIPPMAKNVQGTNIFPLILGDGAFPFKTWPMKPFSHAILKRQEKYFNYRLSRARMVSECAFGSLKGRWRILQRKCESKKETVKCVALACIVLHNVCIERCDVTWRKWDHSDDHTTNKRRPRAAIRQLLQMRHCRRARDSCAQASKIRNALKVKFWQEKLSQGVQ